MSRTTRTAVSAARAVDGIVSTNKARIAATIFIMRSMRGPRDLWLLRDEFYPFERLHLRRQFGLTRRKIRVLQNECDDVHGLLTTQAARFVGRHADANPLEQIVDREIVPVGVEVVAAERRRLIEPGQIGRVAARALLGVDRLAALRLCLAEHPAPRRLVPRRRRRGLIRAKQRSADRAARDDHSKGDGDLHGIDFMRARRARPPGARERRRARRTSRTADPWSVPSRSGNRSAG